ncbi:hypothetical protein PG985_015692 [Apiospora marii]|uniref:Uncharacterized protein n=1 Tax=Apiospora marii TaxID=335849 RepID=A0ABR1S4W2_9PEZI
MFPRLLPRLLKLLVVFIPAFVACNTISLLILQRGMVEPKSPPAAARRTGAGAEAPSPKVPPETDRALVPGKQHAEPEAALVVPDQETCSVATELFAIGEGKDCKPVATAATPDQPHPATTQAQVIDDKKQHPKPEATPKAPSQAHVITTITKTHVDNDGLPCSKTTKRSDVARQRGTLLTQQVFNTSTTSQAHTPIPRTRAQLVHGD